MTERVMLYPAFEPLQSDKMQLDAATRIQRFVYQDTIRLGVDEATARTVADPDDEAMVARQLKRLHNPGPAEYWGVYTRYDDAVDNQMEGVVKVGSWLPGDERMFGRRRELVGRLAQLALVPERLPMGLHVFAVRAGLARATLRAVRFKIPSTAPLNAAVHRDDDELHRAFDETGASSGPTGTKTLGDYTASYVLRRLPSLDKSFTPPEEGEE